MPQIFGWSEREFDERAKGLAALIRKIWRSIARQLVASAQRQQQLAITMEAARPIPSQWNHALDGEIVGFIQDTYLDAAGRISDELNAPEELLVGDDLVEIHVNAARNRLSGIGDEVYQDVKAQIAFGNSNGESVAEIAERVRNVTGVSEARSLTIARTEVHAALEAGSYEQALYVDPNAEKTWLATDDARTRPSHRSADGQTVKIGEPFQIGGVPLRFPGDPLGPAGECINCRCSVAYNFDMITADAEQPEPAMTASGKKVFKPHLHPRGADGKFIEKGAVSDFLKKSKPSIIDVTNAVGQMTPDQWKKLTPDQQDYIKDSVEKLPKGTQTYEKAKKSLDAAAGVSAVPSATNTPTTPTVAKKTTRTNPKLNELLKNAKHGDVIASGTKYNSAGQPQKFRITADKSFVAQYMPNGKFKLEYLKKDGSVGKTINTSDSWDVLVSLKPLPAKGKKQAQVNWDVLDDDTPTADTPTTNTPNNDAVSSAPSPVAPSPTAPAATKIPAGLKGKPGDPAKITTGVVWGKHEPGDVIVDDGAGMLRVVWNGKKYDIQESMSQPGTWVTKSSLSKKDFYDKHKGENSGWFIPGGAAAATQTDADVTPDPPSAPSAPDTTIDKDKLQSQYDKGLLTTAEFIEHSGGDFPYDVIDGDDLSLKQAHTLVVNPTTPYADGQVIATSNDGKSTIAWSAAEKNYVHTDADGNQTWPAKLNTIKTIRSGGWKVPADLVPGGTGDSPKSKAESYSYDPPAPVVPTVPSFLNDDSIPDTSKTGTSSPGAMAYLNDGTYDAMATSDGKYTISKSNDPLGEFVIDIKSPDEPTVSAYVNTYSEVQSFVGFEPWYPLKAKPSHDEPAKLSTGDALHAMLIGDATEMQTPDGKYTIKKGAGAKQFTLTIKHNDALTELWDFTYAYEVNAQLAILSGDTSNKTWIAKNAIDNANLIDSGASTPATNPLGVSKNNLDWSVLDNLNAYEGYDIIFADEISDMALFRTPDGVALAEIGPTGTLGTSKIWFDDELDQVKLSMPEGLWKPHEPGTKIAIGATSVKPKKAAKKAAPSVPPSTTSIKSEAVTPSDKEFYLEDAEDSMLTAAEVIHLLTGNGGLTQEEYNGLSPKQMHSIETAIDKAKNLGSIGAGDADAKWKSFIGGSDDNTPSTPSPMSVMPPLSSDEKNAILADAEIGGSELSALDTIELLLSPTGLTKSEFDGLSLKQKTNISSKLVAAKDDGFTNSDEAVDKWNEYVTGAPVTPSAAPTGPVLTPGTIEDNIYGGDYSHGDIIGQSADGQYALEYNAKDDHVILLKKYGSGDDDWQAVGEYHTLQTQKIFEDFSGLELYAPANVSATPPPPSSALSTPGFTPGAPISAPVTSTPTPTSVTPAAPISIWKLSGLKSAMKSDGNVGYWSKPEKIWEQIKKFQAQPGNENYSPMDIFKALDKTLKTSKPNPFEEKMTKWAATAKGAAIIGTDGIYGKTTPAGSASPLPKFVPANLNAIWNHLQSLNDNDILAVNSKGTKQLKVYTNSDGEKGAYIQTKTASGDWEYYSGGAGDKFLLAQLLDDEEYSSWMKENWTAPSSTSPSPSPSPSAVSTPTPTPASTPTTVNTPAGTKKVELPDIESGNDISSISESAQQQIYSEFKGHPGTYLDSSEETIFDAISAVSKSNGLTLAQIINVVDEVGAKKVGKPNAGLFKKKLTDWLKSPAATAYILNEPVKVTGLPAPPKYLPQYDPNKLLPSFEESSKFEYKPIQSQTAANAFWDDVTKKSSPISSSQKNALKTWTGGTYATVNTYLFKPNQPPLSATHKGVIKGAQEGMRPSDRPILLVRGASYDGLGNAKNHAQLEKMVGTTWRNNAFAATSVGVDGNGVAAPAFSSFPMWIEFECPPGTPMAWLAPFSNFPEREMLLGADLHYRVVSVEKKNIPGHGIKSIVRVRIVPKPDEEGAE